MSIDLFMSVLLGALAALNVAISIAVIRSPVYSDRQKAVQVALTWLLPVLGPLVVGVVLWSDLEPRRRRRQAGGPASGTPSSFGDPLDIGTAAGSGDFLDGHFP